MNLEFAIAEVMPGRLNALVKNIMRQTGTDDPNEAVRLINSGEWVVSRPTRLWREKEGVIYLSVTSDGTTCPEWIRRLEKKGFRLSDYAKSVLCSQDLKPTKGGVTTEIAILKGTLFEDRDRITSNIRDMATQRKLITPNAEVACLIRENLSDEDIEAMGLIWIVTMHKPIVSGGDPRLLNASRYDGGHWLGTCYDGPGGGCSRESGFAFVRLTS